MNTTTVVYIAFGVLEVGLGIVDITSHGLTDIILGILVILIGLCMFLLAYLYRGQTVRDKKFLADIREQITQLLKKENKNETRRSASIKKAPSKQGRPATAPKNRRG